MGENFLPKDEKKRIRYYNDGTVSGFLALFQGRDLVVNVTKAGWIEFPEDRRNPILMSRTGRLRRQLFAVIKKTREKIEKQKKLTDSVIKPDWSANLEECGRISIDPENGEVVIPRWQKDKIVLMHAKNIDSAIGMQRVVGDYYDWIIAEAENYFPLPEDLERLLKKAGIIRPHLELRQQALVYAKQLMEAALDEALLKLSKITASTADFSQVDFQKLAERIFKLDAFLDNQWTCPYFDDVKLAREKLKLAKDAAARRQGQKVQLNLWSAKQLIKSLVESFKRQGDLKKLGAINPIMTLAEIYNLGKTDEVMKRAKSLLNGRDFHLADMLAISRMVIIETRSVTQMRVTVMTDFQLTPSPSGPVRSVTLGSLARQRRKPTPFTRQANLLDS